MWLLVNNLSDDLDYFALEDFVIVDESFHEEL